MKLELKHEDLRTAIHEYLMTRGIGIGSVVDFSITTSRKGGGSRAIVEVLEGVGITKPIQAVEEPLQEVVEPSTEPPKKLFE